MSDERNIYEALINKMRSYPNVLLGVADISYSDYSKDYKCALVLGVPHEEIITLKNYREQKLEDLICNAREEINHIVSDLSKLFLECGIEFYVPPVAQKDEETLLAPFSFKFAAINAGIGWIGKNGVLITREYGPRVRLSAILVNCDLPTGSPITKSLCDDKCSLCVDACPYGALKGMQWDISKLRQELIDYHLCNAKRSLFIKSHNRKNACGLCLVACPVGLG